jgi:hypothetical protein
MPWRCAFLLAALFAVTPSAWAQSAGGLARAGEAPALLARQPSPVLMPGLAAARHGGAFMADPSPGGDSGYGYTWHDSNEAARLFDPGFDSIAGFGDFVPLGTNDASIVSLPFSFDFYGDTYVEVAVHSNGILSFTSTAAVPYGSIGDPAEPNTVVAAYWASFDLDGGPGGVYTAYVTAADGRDAFVVEWNEVPLSDAPGEDPLTFQAWLFADGEIRFAYPFTFSVSIAGATGIESPSTFDWLDVSAQLFNSTVGFLQQGTEIIIQPPGGGGFGVGPRSPDGVLPVDFTYVTETCGSQPSRVQEFVVQSTGAGGTVTPTLSDETYFQLLTPSVTVPAFGSARVRVALVGGTGTGGTPQSPTFVDATLDIAGEEIPLVGRIITAADDAHDRPGDGYRLRTSLADCSADPAPAAALLPFGPEHGDRPLVLPFGGADSLAFTTPFRLYGEPYTQAYLNPSGAVTFEEPADPFRLLVELPPNDGTATAVVSPISFAFFPVNPGGATFPVRGAAYGGVRDVTGDGVDDLVVTFYRVQMFWGGYATWQAILSPSDVPGANGTVRFQYFAGPDPAAAGDGSLYTVLADHPDGLNYRGVAGLSGDQQEAVFHSRRLARLAFGEQPAMFDDVLGAVAVEFVPRTERLFGLGEGPHRAGYRLLSAPAAEMTVADLAEMNLVQGLPDSYPTDGGGSPALPNLLTAYDGVAGYAAPTDLAAPLAPGRGFFWYLYDVDAELDFDPEVVPGTSQSVALPMGLVASGTPQDNDVAVPLTAAQGAEDARWEMVGNPYELPLDVAGMAAWGAGGALASAVGHIWDASFRSYVPTTVLGDVVEPWQGMFIEGGTATGLVIPASAQVEIGVAQRAAPRAVLALALAGATADGTPTLDRGAVLVVDETAADGWDVLDATKLQPPGPSATLAFVGTRGTATALKAQESRPADAPFSVPLAVRAEGVTGEVILTWSGLDAAEARLTDLETGDVLDLRTAGSYAFRVASEPLSADAAASAGPPVPRAAALSPEATQARFRVDVTPQRVVASEPEAAPTLALTLAGANPVSVLAQVRLDAPEATAGRVEVLDVMGRRVATLLDGAVPAGRHALRWDARAAAAGVYVVRAALGGEVRTVRVMVVR